MECKKCNDKGWKVYPDNGENYDDFTEKEHVGLKHFYCNCEMGRKLFEKPFNPDECPLCGKNIESQDGKDV